MFNINLESLFSANLEVDEKPQSFERANILGTKEEGGSFGPNRSFRAFCYFRV